MPREMGVRKFNPAVICPAIFNQINDRRQFLPCIHDGDQYDGIGNPTLTIKEERDPSKKDHQPYEGRRKTSCNSDIR